jgi:hypothetical protein
MRCLTKFTGKKSTKMKGFSYNILQVGMVAAFLLLTLLQRGSSKSSATN